MTQSLSIKEKRSQSGRLGAIKTNIIQFYKKQKRIKEYNLAPKTCLTCKQDIPYEKRDNKFCSQECNGRYQVVRKKTSELPLPIIIRHCDFCNSKLKKYAKRFCNFKCQRELEWKKRKEEFENTGIWQGANNDSSLSRHFKRYIKEKTGHQCSICLTKEWQGKPIPLILDHINGHSGDQVINNLRLVCGNCDMQLPTYKSKNRGNGRAYRRKRYIEGKSY